MFNKTNIYNTADIQQIKISSLLVGKTLAEVAKRIQPGVPISLLDQIAEEYIRDHQGVPSFKGYNGFPATLCISINDVVVHGIPKDQILKDGDIVSVIVEFSKMVSMEIMHILSQLEMYQRRNNYSSIEQNNR